MPDDRRSTVLDSAIVSFARDGFRRTSMDAIAAAADISRPGLYFLFESKEALFREAAAHAVAEDLAAVAAILGDETQPLADRLLDAFDRWAGRWIGSHTGDVPLLLATHPGLLDESTREAPAAFAALVTGALGGSVAEPDGVARTLVSVSVGLKHQVGAREEYRERMRTAVGLLVR